MPPAPPPQPTITHDDDEEEEEDEDDIDDGGGDEAMANGYGNNRVSMLKNVSRVSGCADGTLFPLGL